MEDFHVDRTGESNDTDAEIVVIFPDGHTVRFWKLGLTDDEYIWRAKLIRNLEAS